MSSFKITIPNDQDRSDLEITVHYNKQYPSDCYPTFHVYAEGKQQNRGAADQYTEGVGENFQQQQG